VKVIGSPFRSLTAAEQACEVKASGQRRPIISTGCLDQLKSGASVPLLPQARQVNSGSISNSRTSSGIGLRWSRRSRCTCSWRSRSRDRGLQAKARDGI